ncbi:MAG: CocE/NonD family hydrolase [Candidatus Lokiarchaeota archaeon]|nr:CocE/NonD family hydrolase [Candidatus Lokiarchaeota archaeon]
MQRKFNPNDIKIGLKLPTLLAPLNSIFIRMAFFVDYIYTPLFKIFEIIGRSRRFQRISILPENASTRLKEVLIPLEDGGKLATDIYLPKEIYKNKSKAPTILVRLPYWKNRLSILGYFIASKGYVVVIQDIRGSGRSIEYGTNSLYMYERQDGLETLRWISKRFWYDGKIGMWGLSYLGITQLAVSWNNENLLSCLSPIHSSYSNVFWHPGGLYPVGLSGALYLIMISTASMQNLSTMDFDQWDKNGYYRQLYFNPSNSIYNEPLNSKIPKLSDLASVENPKYSMKMMNSVYKTNVDISKMDEGSFLKLIKEIFYKRNLFHNHDLSPYAFGLNYEFNSPMLFIGGWYDMFIEHMMRDVKLIQDAAPSFFKDKFKMIIGPWSHINMDKFFIKPLKYAHIRDDLTFFQNVLPFWWYELCLKRDESDLSNIPPIRAFVLNKNIWRAFNKWPPSSKEFKLYLHSNGKSNSLFGDGILSNKYPKEELHDVYQFDPSDPVITLGGRNLFLLCGPQDQTNIEKRDDVLVYTTKALERGLEVIGEIRIILFASTTVEDTDFMVKLVDVYPDNKKAVNIIDSGVRTRYLNGDLNNPKLIIPNEIYKFEIVIGTTAIYFPKDHKIRLEITSSNFPRFDVNSNLAGKESEKNYIIASQTVFHDKDHPSHLILPIFVGDE